MEQSRVDIMVDLETLGNTMNASIIQIAAVPFNITEGAIYTEHVFEGFVDIAKSELDVNGSTLKWWFQTNPELLKTLIMKGEKSEEDVLVSFLRWIYKLPFDTVYLWGNGILFDNAIIKQKMKSYGLAYPIRYDKDRDVRTILELASIKENVTQNELKDRIRKEEFVFHNALHDALFQTELVCECYRILTKQEKGEE